MSRNVDELLYNRFYYHSLNLSMKTFFVLFSLSTRFTSLDVNIFCAPELE